MYTKTHLPNVEQWSQSSGSNVILRRARPGLAGLRPHTFPTLSGIRMIPSLIRVGLIPGWAYLSRGGPAYLEAGPNILRRACLYFGGPIYPEAGLSIPRVCLASVHNGWMQTMSICFSASSGIDC